MQKISQSSRFYDKTALRKLQKSTFQLYARAYVGVDGRSLLIWSPIWYIIWGMDRQKRIKKNCRLVAARDVEETVLGPDLSKKILLRA